MKEHELGSPGVTSPLLPTTPHPHIPSSPYTTPHFNKDAKPTKAPSEAFCGYLDFASSVSDVTSNLCHFLTQEEPFWKLSHELVNAACLSTSQYTSSVTKSIVKKTQSRLKQLEQFSKVKSVWISLCGSSVMCDCYLRSCDLCSGLASCALITPRLDSNQLLGPAQKTLACLFKTQITRCLPAAQRFELLALLEKKLTRACKFQAQINSPRFIEQEN
ncbi:hypothetical protein J6590_006694 [Homalodisca vitripennis]|nr:hypothetical protein J6590_006694 [Homalodisca vitripennis]